MKTDAMSALLAVAHDYRYDLKQALSQMAISMEIDKTPARMAKGIRYTLLEVKLRKVDAAISAAENSVK